MRSKAQPDTEWSTSRLSNIANLPLGCLMMHVVLQSALGTSLRQSGQSDIDPVVTFRYHCRP
jgi:hypothetical protein